MKRYLLPENLRKVFSLIHLYAKDYVALVQGLREFVGFKLRSELYPYLSRVAVVGDIVCETFLKYVGLPRICIVDGKTLRETYSDTHIFTKAFYKVLQCRNQAGSISEECLEAIDKALSNQFPTLVLVDGEEDLLTLAVTLLGKDVDLAVFGVPSKGVGIVDVEGFKVTAINFFTQFKVFEESERHYSS